MRGPNNGNPNNPLYNGSSSQMMSSKSPLMPQKQFSASTSSDLMLDKSKESTKLFHTKTYNHIRDMISSRFGTPNTPTTNNSVLPNNASSNSSKNGSGHNTGISSDRNLNNSGSGGSQQTHSSSNNTNNNNSNTNGPYNGMLEMNGTNGLPNSAYGTHNHHHTNMSQHNTNMHVHPSNGNGPPYYVVPQNPSPSGTNGLPVYNGNANGPPNSYLSPSMNDRKNVNTSFRKAIQKSTQKSNLAEESLQMRSNMESQAQNQSNHNSSRDYHHSSSGSAGGVNGNTVQFPSSSSSPGSGNEPHHHHGQPQSGFHAERAQRALDKLLDPSGSIPSSSASFSRPSPTTPEVFTVNSNQAYNRMQQFYPTDDNSGIRSPPILRQNSQQGNYQEKTSASQPNPGLMSTNSSSNVRHGFSGSKPSSKSNGGLAVLENSALSVSYSKSSDEPPPLPTSQKPSHDGLSLIPTLGLPPLLPSVRENGDGSSGTMESSSKCMSSPETMSEQSLAKAEKLKQMSTDLQNLALSVGAENQSSSSEGEVKGSQRVGSGQSHTTTDSGLGTVQLAKSPLHSDHTNEPLDALIGHRLKFSENKAGSISSGKFSKVL